MAKKARGDTSERAVSDFPKHSCESAIRIAHTIEEKNGGRPLPPAEVAIGLGLSPGSSDFRVLLSSSIKYGLSTGSYNQDRVAITQLGARIVAPTSDEDRRDAIKVAVLHNGTFRRIFDHFRAKKLPDDSFFENAVIREFGVPREHAARCVKIFLENVEFAGLARQATTGLWLSSEPTPLIDVDVPDETDELSGNGDRTGKPDRFGNDSAEHGERSLPTSTETPRSKPQRVFISHSKNMEIVDQIKTMLNVAEVPFDIAIEQESTAIPVPEKVFTAMRNCTAAIICVTADAESVESDFKLNENVLIEIGAAFVLYDKKVILVWDRRVRIPSNLQGLYRCEYEGKDLSWAAGMKLMEAVKKFRPEN